LVEKFTAFDQRFDGVDQRFGAIDQQLDGMDQRFSGIDEQFEETKRYFGVVAEGLQSELRQVAEGHQLIMDGTGPNHGPRRTGGTRTWSDDQIFVRRMRGAYCGD